MVHAWMVYSLPGYIHSTSTNQCELLVSMADSGGVESSSGNPDHDHLLYELETSDTSSVGLVLRAIYDGDEHQKFMEKLDARIKSHDRDIERMCNFHYQGFIDSIRELIQVRSHAQKLKSDIARVEEEMQASVAGLIMKSEELLKARQMQSNIIATIECLSLCLPVLETYAKLKRQMKEKRYYPALKTLEHLEQTHLPRVANYRFSQQMRENIPKLRDSIKEASMMELNDFLESIRKHSPKIGKVAMRHAAEQHHMQVPLKTKKRRAPPPPNPFTGEVETHSEVTNGDIEENMSAQDLVDFSPVYRCLHIYTALGARDAFELYYRQQRGEQARLALRPPANMYDGTEEFQLYFQGIVGFFVVEDHILNTADGLVSKAYLDNTWDLAVAGIVAALGNQSKFCMDQGLMLKIKNLIMLFSHTLGGYGYQVNRLSDLLLEVRNQYNSILMKCWAKLFADIFDEDNYDPIRVKSLAEYDAVIQTFPFKDKELEKLKYPKCFPFSQFVPKIYTQVKEYIQACLKFSEDLNLSQTEIDDTVRKSTNMLLTKALSECLSTLIRKTSLGLIQLIQININTNYLEEANIFLEEFISGITGCSPDSSHVAKLQGKNMFKVARVEAEAQIYQQLRCKIDEFIDDANYDWLMSESRGQASSYVVDLIAFLQDTFMSFSNLPFSQTKVAQTAYMTACKHIASSLMNMLTSRDLIQVSMGAVQQFNLDIMQCEVFSSSAPVGEFDLESDVIMCFSDLRQLLDLVMSWDWSTYFCEYGQENSKYLRVTPHTAISLLEKMREADKKNVFAVLKKSERDKKKLLDTVLKQLRHLTTNGTTT